MPLTKSKIVKIMNSQHICIGSIEDPCTRGQLISGTFTPTQDFEKYKKIFLDLEYAANNLLFTHADQLEKKIKELAFYALTPNNRRVRIKDLQIMEGQISWNADNREDIEDV